MSINKILSLLMVLVSISLIVLSGTYNPHNYVMTFSRGEIKSVALNLRAGESESITLKGTDTFTFYIMNESKYNSIENGNFTGSLYVNTTTGESLIFTAPSSGVYYLVIANVNTPGFLQVSVDYGSHNGMYLFLSGVLLFVASILVLIYDLLNSRQEPVSYDSVCPNCGTKVSKSWHYCPNCRFILKGDDDEQ